MIAIDTNVLVRVLVDDRDQMHQVHAARKLAEKNKTLFIPQLVQAELVWVLDYSYELSKEEIIPLLKHLQENEAFMLQHEIQFDEALYLYQTSNISFSDGLILQAAKENEAILYTFDKKFSKAPSVSLLN